MTSPPILSRRATILCWLVVILGAALRYWTIGKDIPYGVGVDEPAIAERALSMVSRGVFNPAIPAPGFFDYPTFTIYLQSIVIVARYLFGTMQGLWSSLGQTSQVDYYVWGRVVFATIGALTILVVYRIGSRWGERVALLAAAAFAVQPWHVRESRFILTDVPMTFFVAVTILASLRASERPRIRWFALAGFCAGLAASTKYNGAVVLVVPVIAALLQSGRRRVLAACTMIGAAAGFLLVAPYTVIELPTFLNAFGELERHFQTSNPEAVHTYLKHMRQAADLGVQEWHGFMGSLSALIGWLMVWASGVGIAIAAWRQRRSKAGPVALGLLVFAAIYFRLITNQSGQTFARYALPLIPVMALGAAVAASACIDAVARRRPRSWMPRIAGVFALALLVLPPGVKSVGLVRERLKQSTLSQAVEWMRVNIPAGDRVIVETFTYLPDPRRFKVTNIESLAAKGLDDYRAEGAVYLVAISLEYNKFVYPNAHSREAAAYATIFAGTEQVALFTPGPDDAHPGSDVRILKIPR